MKERTRAVLDAMSIAEALTESTWLSPTGRKRLNRAARRGMTCLDLALVVAKDVSMHEFRNGAFLARWTR